MNRTQWALSALIGTTFAVLLGTMAFLIMMNVGALCAR